MDCTGVASVIDMSSGIWSIIPGGQFVAMELGAAYCILNDPAAPPADVASAQATVAAAQSKIVDCVTAGQCDPHQAARIIDALAGKKPSTMQDVIDRALEFLKSGVIGILLVFVVVLLIMRAIYP